MIHLYSNSKKSIIAVVALVLVAAIAAGVFVINYVVNDEDNTKTAMLEKAKSLYDSGDFDEALYQLELYLADYPYDTDGNTLMGDWYMAENNQDKAMSYYKTAAENLEYDSSILNQSNLSTIISRETELSFTIKPSVRYIRNATLTFSDTTFKVSDDFQTGAIFGTATELQSNETCKTTQWFTINNTAKYITIFGGINCATWQFLDINNNIIFSYSDDNLINRLNIIRFDNNESSTVEIPHNAVQARVTYYDSSIEDSMKLEDNAYVQYSNYISGYTTLNTTVINIPDISEDEYIEYKNGKWTLFSDSDSTELELDKIPDNLTYVTLNGTLTGEVDFSSADDETEKSSSSDKSKQYGIKYKSGDSMFACQRIDDAANMRFDYTINNEWAGSGVNDFDNAYPWSEMKLCNVKQGDDGSAKVTYEDDEKFSIDGSNGNVMVEIPKFYSKRVVKDGYEYLWVSGKNHDGYVVDPAFIGENGDELDHIYVAAYYSSLSDDTLVSTSESNPAIKLNLNDIREAAANNGSNFEELDYLTYAALQRLFIIETGNINSSSLFEGVTGDYFFYEDSANSGCAINDEENSNTIILNKGVATSRLQEGDDIAIFKNWDEYKNTSNYHRIIESMTENEDGTYTITFSGDPVDIKAGETGISNIPAHNGKTDSIDYCSGINNRGAGKSSFKYRGIENLYGNLCTILDKAYFVHNDFTYIDGSGAEYTIYDSVPTQLNPVTDAVNQNESCFIKSMIYDEDNPLIMLPSKLGDNATSISGYGDFWQLYSKDDSSVPRYLAVGGADDNFNIAGIFHMRAFITESSNASDAYSYLGSRIMYKPNNNS